MKKWLFSELDKNVIKEFSQKTGLPVFTAMLLHLRGFTEPGEIEKYFDASCTLPDPFLIKDMDKAVKRVNEAISSYEPVCIFGDYDCDGVTATALLFSYLQSVGANVSYYIPDRNAEGYGMNIRAIDQLKEKGVSLIITVDNAGNVTGAKIQEEVSTDDRCLREFAIRAARLSKFSSDPKAPARQAGNIVYQFLAQ